MKKLLLITPLFTGFILCPGCATAPSAEPEEPPTPTVESLKSRIVVPSETEAPSSSDLRSRIYVPSEG